MSLSKQIKDSMVESIDDKIADIADLVGEKGEIVTDRMKTLGFSEYVELMKAVKNTDEETARDILGLGIEEGSFEPHDGAFDWDANMDDDDVEYGIIRYPDTAISYIKNDGSGWMHMYDKSYGFSGPVDKEDMQYASEIEKEKIPSRMFKEAEQGSTEYYRDLDKGQLNHTKSMLMKTAGQLNVAIEQRYKFSKELMGGTGDRAGTGDLQKMLDTLNNIIAEWDEETKLYGK